jgi:hypothetical protein
VVVGLLGMRIGQNEVHILLDPFSNQPGVGVKYERGKRRLLGLVMPLGQRGEEWLSKRIDSYNQVGSDRRTKYLTMCGVSD